MSGVLQSLPSFLPTPVLYSESTPDSTGGDSKQNISVSPPPPVIMFWRRGGDPLQYSSLENPHGQRSLGGYSPQRWKRVRWG